MQCDWCDAVELHHVWIFYMQTTRDTSARDNHHSKNISFNYLLVLNYLLDAKLQNFGDYFIFFIHFLESRSVEKWNKRVKIELINTRSTLGVIGVVRSLLIDRKPKRLSTEFNVDSKLLHIQWSDNGIKLVLNTLQSRATRHTNFRKQQSYIIKKYCPSYFYSSNGFSMLLMSSLCCDIFWNRAFGVIILKSCHIF